MTDSQSKLVGWVQGEFADEQRGGFARLKRVPDTQVIRFLDHFGSLDATQQAELTGILAEWSSYKLLGVSIPSATVDEFTRACTFRWPAEGLRYTGVALLAGLAKFPGGLDGWFQSRGITGLAQQLPEGLVPSREALVPAKPASLQRLVKASFAKLFAPTAKDLGDGHWRYEGRLAGSSVKVLIRFSGKMGRPQLDYQVTVQSPARGITAPNVCFESILGVRFGRWDYLTQENAERSVKLLCELVEYVARVPERLSV